jgi:RNA polymerase subunit RPABC4/transcription elongation factor Spt4
MLEDFLLSQTVGMKHYALEQIIREKQNLCPRCGTETMLILTFECIHCNAVHHFFECPECGDRMIIPEDQVTIMVR